MVKQTIAASKEGTFHPLTGSEGSKELLLSLGLRCLMPRQVIPPFIREVHLLPDFVKASFVFGYFEDLHLTLRSAAVSQYQEVETFTTAAVITAQLPNEQHGVSLFNLDPLLLSSVAVEVPITAGTSLLLKGSINGKVD